MGELSIINHRPSTRRAFTLVECLIGLAISAMLLAAVAVAFNASAINYSENEEMYETINNARQALTRMTSQLRTGYFVDPSAASNRCNFFTATNQNISYLFNNGTLYLVTNSDGRQYVLCNSVTAATFTKTPTDNGLDCKSVQISLTVRIGNFQRTLAAAAVIRRNLPF
ncbi:MAG: prepilin-type N-terminal cleavage/methylation domain-containing protein [Sedimentisphaerales bacterium]|nr:prepilin-type N-terminal cleavage/methylation domain-containing protein [Sedimentisphaerales bacterium]